jgi:hypothetical protein
MKNLIVQHYVIGEPGLDPNREFEGNLPMLVKRSSENVKSYSDKFNADYKLLNGTPFDDSLSYKSQKCAIINEEYDEYDVVVAMDTDAFFTKKCEDNLFLETGIGYSGKVQSDGLRRVLKCCPNISSINTSFWSGAVYVLERSLRQKLRHILETNDDVRNSLPKLDQSNLWDEGIFHVLCSLADVGKVSLDQKWNYDSYLPDVRNANIIHVRHRPKPRDENYIKLVNEGII